MLQGRAIGKNGRADIARISVYYGMQQIATTLQNVV
jgi:hypothetical protein